MIKTFTTALLVLTLFCPAFANDKFDSIKTNLSETECLKIEFNSIIVSDIFETTDTARGILVLSGNKFKLTLESDIYLQDDSNLYSYSIEENQLVIEPADPQTSRELIFITRLDELYNTRILKADSEYELTLKEAGESDYPAEMTIILNSDKTMIQTVKYYDLNEELNIIEILNSNTDQPCSPDQFIPDFPESAERIKL